MPRPLSLVRGDATRRQQAIARAQELRPILDELRSLGITGWYKLATKLNERGLRSIRGGSWSGTQLRVVIQRLEADSDANPH